MTVWIVWILAIGLIFGLGLASARASHREQIIDGVNPVKSVPKNDGLSTINGPTNKATSGRSSNVAAGSGALSSRNQSAAASEI